MSLVGSAHQSLVFGRRIRVLGRHIASMLPREATVLDVGCGNGLLALQVMSTRPDLRIEGVEVLERPDAGIPVQLFDGRTLPFADGSVDAAMLVDVLHHTDDPAALLCEASRVSRTAVVVKDHFRTGFLAGPTLRLMDWVGNAHHGVALPYNYHTPAQWESTFARAGLAVEIMRTKLHLYPPPVSWWFDRRLHFITRLRHHHSRER